MNTDPRPGESAQHWFDRGSLEETCGREIFVLDSPAQNEESSDPVVIIHGFPTSGMDFAPILDTLNQHRRVIAMDLLGFGFSDKPDEVYTLENQADIVEALLARRELSTFALLTHDMGDTVGGELLARQLDGTWSANITKRVVTNGSIYIEMAQLTAGQKMLLSMPDEALPAELAPDVESLANSLAATLSVRSPVSARDMVSHAEVLCLAGGNTLLPRTIRYVEQRRENESRYTGAIESHPSPLGIIWGDEDPIAVPEMARTLADKRPDARLIWMKGVGHYPQIEQPADFVSHLLSLLDDEIAA